MAEVPIKRGTAIRLGLALPRGEVTLRIEPDLSRWDRAWGRHEPLILDNPADWTPAQIEAMLPKAIEKGDAEFIKSALMLLALKDPRRAQQILNTMEVGFMLAKEMDRG